MYRLQQLFSDVKKIVQQALDEKRGRPKKRKPGGQISDRVAAQTVIIKLLAAIKGWSINFVHKQLANYRDSTWRQLCGIPYSQIPIRRTLQNRWHHHRIREWQERLWKRLLPKILNCRNLRILAIDMTDLPRSFSDNLANFGVCGKGGFYGYKLHLVVTKDGIPLAFLITKANRRETAFIERIAKQLKNQLKDTDIENIVFVVADSAYDSNRAYEAFGEDLSSQLIADVNPRNNDALKDELSEKTKERLKSQNTPRSQGVLLSKSPEGKNKRKSRHVIEQVFDQLKNSLNLLSMSPYIKGVRRVTEFVKDKIFTFVCMLYCNKLHRNGLRQIASYLV